MSTEEVEKVGDSTGKGHPLTTSKAKKRDVIVALVLRVVAFLASATATIVMALNKETITIVVAVVGTTRVFGDLTAKFQTTPAFVFFVVANSIASLHHLMVLAFSLLQLIHSQVKELELYMAISDLVILALVTAGSAAASALGELGKNGNKQARWNKICDRFETYCDRASAAIFVSYAVVALSVALNAIGIINNYKRKQAL